MDTELTQTTDLPIAQAERDDFARLDGVIEKGLGTFVEVGRALMEIRDRRLYREQYGTFEEYTKQRHELGTSHAYRLIDSATLVNDLSPNGGQAPANERQCRELLKLPDGDQQAVWQEVCDAKDEQGEPVKITAKLIRETAAPYLPEKAKNSFSGTRNSHPETVWGFASNALG